MAFFTNAEGNFFIQSERAEPFEWLTCTGVGDIELPKGDRTAVYCPDPLQSGRFKIDGFIRGTPGAGTYSLTKPLASVFNFLLEQDCAFQGRINWVCRGQRQDTTNYEVAVIMHNSEMSRQRIPAPVINEGTNEARVTTEADVSFQLLQVLYPLTVARQTVVNAAAGNAVYFLPQQCEDRCGAARGLAKYGIIGLDGPAGYLYESEIKKTANGGSAWSATPTDPYTFGGNTSQVLLLETASGIRYIVFRGAAVAGAPAECGISDDEGVTWNNVTIGSVNGQYITSYTLVGANIVVGASGGYIYVSTDFGLTWTAQESGSETTETIRAIAFYDNNTGYAVCDANVVLKTSNAGGDWATATGPAVATNLHSLGINDKGHVFVGNNAAQLWVSMDGAVSWTLRTSFSGGSIDWISFDPTANYIGALIYNNTTPRGYLYRTEDGGATWPVVPNMPNNAGLNGGFICDPNHIFVVGEPMGGTTFIATTLPA